MGARGPKPGFRKAVREGAETPLSSVPASTFAEVAIVAEAAPANVEVTIVVQPAPADVPCAVTPADAEFASWFAATQPQTPVARELAVPTAADLENPEKLTGQALRDLAHRRGLARSALADMPDAKVRMELLYITNRQYREEEESA